MKKALVLTLAAVAFLGSANVAEAQRATRRSGLDAVRAARDRELDKRNTRNAAPQATISAEGVRIQQSISTSGLSGVTSQSTAALAKHGSAIKGQFDTIIANKNADANMVTLQLNALSLLPEAKGTPQAKEIAADLIVGAGSKSIRWADKKSKENVEFMIRETMEGLAKGQTLDTALANAKDQLHRQKGVDIDLAKIKELCK
jgi:hypothetical protein